ncbi:hypothetical protein LCGC14_2821460, partial [marine sediment metagenome]
MQSINSLAIFGLLSLFFAAVAPADVVISQWHLLTGVQDFGDPSEQDGAWFDSVENPFDAEHAVALPPPPEPPYMASHVAYDFWWEGNSASFDVDIDHQFEVHIEDSRSSFATGWLYLTTTVDLTLTADAFYTYAFPPAASSYSHMKFRVADVDNGENLFSQTEFGGTIWLEPPSATLALATTLTLPAGREYFIQYRFGLDTFDNSAPGEWTTAFGSVSWTLRPVPEPATISLLALAAAPLLRPR